MSRGFTLVELLVVIAIIALLSSFAIVALTQARLKANQGAIKHNLGQIRTATEIYFSSHGTYRPTTTWVCGMGATEGYPASCAGTMYADPGVKRFADAIAAVAHGMSLYAAPNSWAAVAVLPGNSDYYWCADSSGYVGPAAINGAAGGGSCGGGTCRCIVP